VVAAEVPHDLLHINREVRRLLVDPS
jgi:hypothetical protein